MGGSSAGNRPEALPLLGQHAAGERQRARTASSCFQGASRRFRAGLQQLRSHRPGIFGRLQGAAPPRGAPENAGE
eukprot:15150533-Alexandrium_andersonii.AAC.1